MIALGQILGAVTSLYILLTIVLVVVSWVNADPQNMIVRMVVSSTEPFLRVIRRYTPALGGRVDWSPLLLFLLLLFIYYFVVQSLMDYGSMLRMAGMAGAQAAVAPF